MSFVRRLLGGAETKASDFAALTWSALLGGQPSKSGVSVNVDTALRTSAALGCCRVLAEGIAQLPLKVMREDESGKKTIEKKHPLHKILWRKPNDWMTSFELRETLMYHALLAESGSAYVSRSSRTGDVLEVIPLVPGRVKPLQDRQNRVAYELSDANGVVGIAKPGELFRIRGPSWNGYRGMEMIQQARDALGLTIAIEEGQAKFHANGARPSGVVGLEGAQKPEVMERLRRSWVDTFGGVGNTARTVFLDNAAKYTPIVMTGVDAQLLETRKFQVEDVARMFRVFPQLLGYSDKTSTYASAEQFFLAHVIHSLGPWIERWEQSIARDLLTEDELDKGYFAKFSVQGLLRGDAKSRAEFYSSGILNGWLVRNEARRIEDLDPLDGLDEPLVPLNMATRGGGPAGGKADPVDQKALARAIAEELGVPGLEQKLGRVLSAQNEGRLKDARDLISEVIAQVDVEDAAA